MDGASVVGSARGPGREEAGETSGLYSLRRADPSVRLAAVLFMLVLGYAYVFAFFMVKDWAGLTPARVSATYAPMRPVDASSLPEASSSSTQPLDLGGMTEETHRVDARLLVQDSHIHIMIYAIVGALQTLLILGLGWGAAWRNVVITAAFGAGALDFSGQWLVKAGLPGFSWLTIASGWLMAAVYVVVLTGTLRAAAAGGRGRAP
jgi:hypothetical protein